MTNSQARNIKILSVQENPVVGDILTNAALAESAIYAAIENHAQIVVFSELFLIGYPPEDLVLKPSAIEDCKNVLLTMAANFANGPIIVIGLPWRENGLLYNAAAVLHGGQIKGIIKKSELPNYAVFDEKRVFEAGQGAQIVELDGLSLGIAICEDIWVDRVCAGMKALGAGIILVLNGSPYRRGVLEERFKVTRTRNSETNLPIIYVNQIGGQDELCFDGGSFIVTEIGHVIHQIPQFITQIALSEWMVFNHNWHFVMGPSCDPIDKIEQDYAATVLALRDYVDKNDFPGVIIGMSGGIDSALSAAIAVDAIGSDRVKCVMLPSKYTSEESLNDARLCSKKLGVEYEIISIEKTVAAFENALKKPFRNTKKGSTEENIQSRARAVILMALSNKFGHMVLTTGNKSEMAVGYATLYGDMCGGYNCLKDIYKTDVYKLANWRNKFFCQIGLGPLGQVIPENIINKAPTAELRENQKDSDSLPEYEILDEILQIFIEKEGEIEDVMARGHDFELAKRIQNLIYIAEYKRRQAPPGVKIGSKNFGRDRRYPITNKYRDYLNK